MVGVYDVSGVQAWQAYDKQWKNQAPAGACSTLSLCDLNAFSAEASNLNYVNIDLIISMIEHVYQRVGPNIPLISLPELKYRHVSKFSSYSSKNRSIRP